MAKDLIVVTRHRVDDGSATAFAGRAHSALGVLAARPGFVDGAVGRNLDDPALWTITTTWRDVGSYRRALSHVDVKMVAVPLLSTALDEPSAYEVVGQRAGQPPR